MSIGPKRPIRPDCSTKGYKSGRPIRSMGSMDPVTNPSPLHFTSMVRAAAAESVQRANITICGLTRTILYDNLSRKMWVVLYSQLKDYLGAEIGFAQTRSCRDKFSNSIVASLSGSLLLFIPLLLLLLSSFSLLLLFLLSHQLRSQHLAN